MNKRDFLTVALGSALLPGAARASERKAPPAPDAGPALLTITGAIKASNRGPFNPALDQLMAKHKLHFDRACAFDYAALSRLPALNIRPTLEYDRQRHSLSGPLLSKVLRESGAPTSDVTRLTLRGLDGYAVQLTLGDCRRYQIMVATRMDGHPLPLGGLGPLWAVVDADNIAELSAKPVNERFTLCPWGLYHVDVELG